MSESWRLKPERYELRGNTVAEKPTFPPRPVEPREVTLYTFVEENVELAPTMIDELGRELKVVATVPAEAA